MPRVTARRTFLDDCLAHEDWRRFEHLGLYRPSPALFPKQEELFRLALSAGIPIFSAQETNVITVRMVAALIGTDVIWGTLDKAPPKEDKACSRAAFQSGLHVLLSGLGSAMDWLSREVNGLYRLDFREEDCSRGVVRKAFQSGLGRLAAEELGLKGPNGYLKMCQQSQWVWDYRNRVVHRGFVETSSNIDYPCQIAKLRLWKHPEKKQEASRGPSLSLKEFCQSAFIDTAQGLNVAYEEILKDATWILDARSRSRSNQVQNSR